MQVAVSHMHPCVTFRPCCATQKPKNSAYPKGLKTLGDHIRERRLDLELFQKQVAEQIGVDETTVYHWERNATSPQIHVLPQVIGFLGYDPTLSP